LLSEISLPTRSAQAAALKADLGGSRKRKPKDQATRLTLQSTSEMISIILFWNFFLCKDSLFLPFQATRDFLQSIMCG
jgi:hypothetical protein